ncbi:dCTP deaminase domain-containing protein [Patulibacter sp. S7RM1-6]
MHSSSVEAPVRIAGFQRDCLQHSAYYFRLGPSYQRRRSDGEVEAPSQLDESRGELLRFAPREYIQVVSAEEFALSGRALGILGAVSDVGAYGLTMVNSLFIDPFFPGLSGTAPLSLGLVNLNPTPASLAVGSRIGKVAFFDVSDSSGMALDPQSDIAFKFASRRMAPPEGS